jgi:hypothetical protein
MTVFLLPAKHVGICTLRYERRGGGVGGRILLKLSESNSDRGLVTDFFLVMNFPVP